MNTVEMPIKNRSGLDHLRAQMNGLVERSPAFDTFAMRLIQVAYGKVVVEANPGPNFINTLGTVHGGYAAALLDTALGCAVHTILDRACNYTTVDLKVNYIRPMSEATGTVHVVGEVAHDGRKIATATGEIRSVATNKLIAHGVTTCLIFPDDSAEP